MMGTIRRQTICSSTVDENAAEKKGTCDLHLKNQNDTAHHFALTPLVPLSKRIAAFGVCNLEHLASCKGVSALSFLCYSIVFPSIPDLLT